MAAGPGAAGTARVSSGRDLNCVPEVAGALGAVARQGFDFLCLPLFHPRHRREFRAQPARARPGPQTRSDLVLAGRDWNTLIVGKLSPWIRPDSPLEHVRKNSRRALQQELDFGAYLGLAAHLVPLRGPHNPNLARGLSAHLHSGHHATQVTGLYWFIGFSAHLHSGHHATQFWVQVPLVPPEDCRDDVIGNEAPPTGGDEENTWEWWHKFRTLLDYNKRVALALEIGPDLPSPAALARWLGEPVRAAFLPTRLFLTNKKGFPVLARGHQRLLGQLLKLDVQIIVQGSPRHGGRPLAVYLQYLEHLGQHRPPPSAYEVYARGYEDYLQSPLQ
ncbi:protein arginine N-methyltransferase 5, partial [Agelaius phoeniceus]|uniref:protein arginine N-methyltransferase 5 n=1 Tax=Agelaius phoeniceus TaxID=39638 RepID=UPI004054B55A